MRVRQYGLAGLADAFAVSVPLTGVVIAGGLGTRLRSVVADRPKCLALVNGEPFVFRLLRQMAEAGVTQFLLCTGFGADQVQQCLGSEFAGVPISYSQESQPLGTAGALKLAFQRYGCESSWLVMNGDSYLDLNIAQFRDRFEQSSSVGAIAASRVPDGRRFGALKWSADGHIFAFEEKSEDAGPKWINGGVYLLSPAVLRAMPSTVPLSLEKDVFPSCIPSGMFAYPCQGKFIDIGLPESFAEAQTFFSEAIA